MSEPQALIGPGRILLVDHSRGALLFQETILRRRDMQIMTALAGSEAKVMQTDALLLAATGRT